MDRRGFFKFLSLGALAGPVMAKAKAPAVSPAQPEPTNAAQRIKHTEAFIVRSPTGEIATIVYMDDEGQFRGELLETGHDRGIEMLDEMQAAKLKRLGRVLLSRRDWALACVLGVLEDYGVHGRDVAKHLGISKQLFYSDVHKLRRILEKP